ncbi:hypothetical protein [Cellulomonas dongxiuzhuiae]|uniref:DUF222 domain-containing protein n=1 Tax=Cellulomonas dongxiuzhuiae TaxID=2819979 RepID=A0ABX8GHP1_9CELL|nr:hypothetical protein [Cellulomonas dongxiuzhuiae]MBO3094699.1 hypothetical protein [Cellulomonas dongxiuzhuiae]QWC15702.1 hypothetical protein KKR89_15685 [Cellulomonas dongxiuzhuiae]
MATDNPAGRLHALLTEFQEHAHENRSITHTWALTLDCDPSEVVVALGEVAGLLADIRRVVGRIDSPGATELLLHFGEKWAGVIFTPDRNMTQGSHGLVTHAELAALAGLSALLSSTASEGAVVDMKVTAELRSTLLDVLQEVRADSGLPADLRAILVARIHDMLWAIDHLATVGADGVKAAAERLAGALAIRPNSADKQHPIVAKVLSAAGKAWTFFTMGPKVQQSLEGWNGIVGQIGPGSA